MSERCDGNIFSFGHSVATLDACRYRAEDWVQQIANMSGQLVDWHYTGGIVNVLYLGDYDKVATAVKTLSPTLTTPMPRIEGECGSCDGPTHRLGRIMNISGTNCHGPYRAGDLLPDDVIVIDTH